MAESERAGWQPETDVDYGQRLVGYLLLKHKALMLGLALFAALAAFCISLFLPANYRSDGSIVVDKGISASSSLLSGLMGPMGGGNTALESEKQVLISRDIARQVMDELGLRIRIVDPLSPDAPGNRLLKYLHLRKKPKFSREELYSKLRLENVQINPELQSKAEYVLRTSKNGTLQIGSQRFQPGQEVVLSEASFTPVLGQAHVPGQAYKLTILPAGQSFLDWRDQLGVIPVNDKANVLRVSYRCDNPFTAQRVVELVTEGYFSRYSSKSTESYDAILEYITGEITATKTRSEELTTQLTQFREEHKAYAPTAQGQSAMLQIAEISRTLMETKVQEMSVDSALKAMQSRTPQEIYDLIQAPATTLPLESELMLNLSKSLNALAQAKQTKTDAHPEVRQLNASITVLVEQIKNSLRTNLQQLRTAKNEQTSSLDKLKGSLEGLPEAEGQVALLMAELEANSEIMKVLATSEAQTRLKRASTTTDVQNLDVPVVADRPDSPRPLFNAFLGALIGLVLAIFIGLIAEVADPRMRTLRELRLGLGIPVLGVLPGPAWRRRRWHPATRDADLLKRLAGFLRCKGRVINIIHPLGPGGGYDLAWGLAAATAEPGKPALLIDADRLGDGLAQALDKPNGDGLVQVAQGKSELDKALQTLSEDRRLLTLGPGELTRSELEPVLTQLRERFATILVCLPSSLRWVDQGELAALAGETFITVPQQGSSREELQQALRDLRLRNIEPRGAIVTNYAASRDVLGQRELRQVAVPLD